MSAPPCYHSDTHPDSLPYFSDVKIYQQGWEDGLLNGKVSSAGIFFFLVNFDISRESSLQLINVCGPTDENVGYNVDKQNTVK